MAIGEWAVRWMFAEPQPREVDPVTLTWWLSRRLAREQLPHRRVVIEFDYTGEDATRIWLILDRGEASVEDKVAAVDAARCESGTSETDAGYVMVFCDDEAVASR